MHYFLKQAIKEVKAAGAGLMAWACRYLELASF